MGRKTNSMGYKKGFASYQKITTKHKKAPDFGIMYTEMYGDRALTLFLTNYMLGFDSEECQISFVMGEYLGSLFCTMDCAGKFAGKPFTGKVAPSIKDKYQSPDRREWIIPFYFCDEPDIEVIGQINTIDQGNSYYVDLSQPGPPVRLF